MSIGLTVSSKKTYTALVSSKTNISTSLVGRKDKRPVFAFTFDDYYASILTTAKPMLDTYGWRATCFPKSADIADHLSHYQTLYAAGWEIGSHTVTHASLASVSEEDLITELSDSKDNIIAAGLGTPRSIAYPVGSYNANVLAKAALYYEYGRTTDMGYHIETASKYALKSVNMYPLSDVAPWEDVVGMITECASRGGLCIFYTHGVQDPETNYVMSVAHFTELCALVNTLGYRVLPFSEALDYYNIRTVVQNKNIIMNPSLNYFDYDDPTVYLWYKMTDTNSIVTMESGSFHCVSESANYFTLFYLPSVYEPNLKRDTVYRFGIWVDGTVQGETGAGVRVGIIGVAGWTNVYSETHQLTSERKFIYVDFTISEDQTIFPASYRIYWLNATGDTVFSAPTLTKL